MPSVVRAFAPSKVNLALSVGAPGADGMHPISSWMVTTRFGDDLTVKRLAPGTPSRYAIEWHEDALRKTEIDWRISKDLAVRAQVEQREAAGAIDVGHVGEEAAVGGEGVAVRARLVGRRQPFGGAGAVESRAEVVSLRGVVG